MIADFASSLVSSVGRALAPRNAILENPNFSFTDPAAYEFFGGSALSDAGIRINHNIALTLAPVWQAVSMISGDAASVPRDMYSRKEDGDISIADKHAGRFLIASEWNDETPAYEGWRRCFAHALLWNNGYGYIERKSRRGDPLALINLLPDRTAPIRLPSGELAYTTEVDGKPETLFKEEVLHIKGLSLDAGRGADLVHHARNSVGLALAAEGYSSKFFANGAQAGGSLVVPTSFTEKAVQKLEEGWRKRTSKDNWFKVAILRDGATFQAATIDAQKAQLHDLRIDQVADICRFFNLPPFKLGIPGSVSYNSTEQGQLLYLTSALMHWLLAAQTESEMKLRTLEERKAGNPFIDHNTQSWLANQLDIKTKNEVLEIQRRNEVINADEWRQAIHRNKRTDPGGAEYVNPNVRSAVPGSTESGGGSSDPKEEKKAPEGAPPVPAPAPPAKPAKKPPKQIHRALLEEAINRVARRVCHDAVSKAKQPQKLQTWLDGSAIEHRKVLDDALRNPLVAWCAVHAVENDSAGMRCDISGRFFLALLGALQPYLDAPHKAVDLESNVTAACLRFEATIANELLTFTGEDE